MFRIIGAVLLALAASTAMAETPLERGAYLVNAVMGCDGCHTPRGPGGFDMSKRFSGGSQVFDEPEFTVKGSNITPDRETGIGSWSDADIKKLMTEGVRPNGVPVAQMPYTFYKIMTPSDLDAVVAYIKTVTPVRNEVQPPNYKAAHHAELVPGGEKPIGDVDAHRSGAARLLSRHLGALHGVPFAKARGRPGLQELVGQGRPRDEGAVRLGEGVQHHSPAGRRASAR